jgi:hypothetical protein
MIQFKDLKLLRTDLKIFLDTIQVIDYTISPFAEIVIVKLSLVGLEADSVECKSIFMFINIFLFG